MKAKKKLIMMRHGQSEWNKLNLFTGWVDIPLSVEGIQEALEAGKKIAHLPIDIIFVSSLVRAQMTAMLAMTQHEGGKVPKLLHPGEGLMEDWGQIYSERAEHQCIPVVQAWQLNERMYGQLQGLNKRETMDKFGEKQVQMWRRSFDIRPPEGESLAMTAERTLPYFKDRIVPELQKGRNVFISAHGNSLRAIVMHLDGLSKEEVIALELATGEPIIYSYFDGSWEKESLHG
ncbi:MAG: 2,3-bisphosphoglycerate-dependent phosphoglycerate mutase [Anaerolineae bacterium]